MDRIERRRETYMYEVKNDIIYIHIIVMFDNVSLYYIITNVIRKSVKYKPEGDAYNKGKILVKFLLISIGLVRSLIVRLVVLIRRCSINF